MRTLTTALCLLATPALADVAGTASVIDGDTIEVHGYPGHSMLFSCATISGVRREVASGQN